MASKKQYKSFDKTSAAQARFLDDLRERNKKSASKKFHGRSASKPGRGGFR